MSDRIRACGGQTLTELLVMLGIAGVLAAAAGPSFSRLLQDSRMAAVATATLHAVSGARQLAATRAERVTLCGDGDGQSCSDEEDWSSGLLLSGESAGLRRAIPFRSGPGTPRVHSNRAAILFESGAGFATPATITICDRRGAPAARAIIVSRSGRPRLSTRDATGGPLAC